jgi:hypothetical protein
VYAAHSCLLFTSCPPSTSCSTSCSPSTSISCLPFTFSPGPLCLASPPFPLDCTCGGGACGGGVEVWMSCRSGVRGGIEPQMSRGPEGVQVLEVWRYGGLEAVEGSEGGQRVWRRSKVLEAAEHESSRDGRKLWRRSKAVEVVGRSGGGRELWRWQQALEAVVSKLWKRQQALEAVEGSLEDVRGSRGGRRLRRQQARSSKAAGSPGGGRRLWRRSKVVVEVVGSSGGGSKVWRCTPPTAYSSPTRRCL